MAKKRLLGGCLTGFAWMVGAVMPIILAILTEQN
jgi:hypothetical protein